MFVFYADLWRGVGSQLNRRVLRGEFGSEANHSRGLGNWEWSRAGRGTVEFKVEERK